MSRNFGFVCLILVSSALSGCVDLDTSLQASTPAKPNVASLENADLAQAKREFHNSNYGLAAEAFRIILEKDERNAEAWLGLAASYDQLTRFDLADRAYEQVIKLVGRTPILLNNRGYSYLRRGDRAKARQDFAAARKLDPSNGVIVNNLALLN